MTATLPRLGFIGVGAMGLPMARNLLRAGYPLTFCTRRDAAAEALGAAGGERATDASAVAAACDVLLTCLPADAEIAATLLGEAGALAALRPGAAIIELSTASPEIVRALAEAGAPRDIAVLDAPVSGGVGGAEAASLSIMVGGEAATLERCRPILATLGQQLYHVGPVGMGKVFQALQSVSERRDDCPGRRSADVGGEGRGRSGAAGRGHLQQFRGVARADRGGPGLARRDPAAGRLPARSDAERCGVGPRAR